jgi:V/A-type H+/Na+-transporting ATPase subunit I
MNIDMLPLEIIGLKSDLHSVVQTLRLLGCVQIDSLAEFPTVSARPLALDRDTLQKLEVMNFLVARLEGMLDILGYPKHLVSTPLPDDFLTLARLEVDRLLPKVQALTSRREKLLAEQASLPHYEATLRKLLPIIPPSAHEPGNSCIGVLVNREHTGVLDSVCKRILESSAGRAEVVASDVDLSTRAMLIVFPIEFMGELEALLGHEDVSRLRLPAELGEGPPDVVLTSLHRRLATIPDELKEIDTQLGKLSTDWAEKLLLWRDALRDVLDADNILSQFGETDMSFVVVGWIPAKDFEAVRSTLNQKIGDSLLVQPLPLTSELKKRAPIALDNPALTRPFESLVKLLALPRYGHLDPTQLMAFFFPIFFGMMLGDVAYGVILLLIGLFLLRKYKKGIIRDVLLTLVMGSAWAIVFGFLYGEAFGTLGEKFGLRPLWFDRVSAENVAALLVMTIVIGAAHITLGLILGVWEAIRDRSRSHLLERGGMLVGLVSLFMIIAVVRGYLPDGLMTPAIVALIIGIVLLSASLGWLGILMGPIEFIGLIGNVLSYLRIAAIGLASVYLAKVANEVAGLVGSAIVGIIIAVLIHSLNLVLGAFSPTVHSLRLHYVEFFRKFYEGGGRPYQPFKRQYGEGVRSE